MAIKLLNATEQTRRTAESAMAATEELSVVTVRGAILAPARRFVQDDSEAFVGGVHRPDGEPVGLSLLRRGGQPTMVARPADEVGRLDTLPQSMEAAYGGLLIPHFGHFTLESTARLWWILQSGFAGPIVFQAVYPETPAKPYIREFFALLGIADRILVVDRPMRFETLHVPAPSFEIRGFAHAAFLTPFQAIGANVSAQKADTGEPRRIYLSRSRLDTGLCIGEDLIESVLRKDGYRIVHPETLLLKDQIELLLGAERIVGVLGSALHNVLYAAPKSVCYIGRSNKINANFPLIDAVCGNDALYVMGSRKPREQPGHGSAFLLDPELIVESMIQEGWLTPARRHDLKTKDLRRHYLAELELQAATLVVDGQPPAGSAGGRLRRLLLAAALRPGDRRTLRALIAILIERKRLRIADRFARELVARSGWDAAITDELAAQFRAAGKPSYADRLLAHADDMRARKAERATKRNTKAA